MTVDEALEGADALEALTRRRRAASLDRLAKGRRDELEEVLVEDERHDHPREQRERGAHHAAAQLVEVLGQRHPRQGRERRRDRPRDRRRDRRPGRGRGSGRRPRRPEPPPIQRNASPRRERTRENRRGADPHKPRSARRDHGSPSRPAATMTRSTADPNHRASLRNRNRESAACSRSRRTRSSPSGTTKPATSVAACRA